QQRKAQVPRPRGPLPMVKRWLKRKLPQQAAIWQADARQMANTIQVGGEKVRPWVVLVLSHSNDLVLAHATLEEEPGAAALWATLVQAMQNPGAGEPHRPTALQVRADARWQALRPHVEEVGVHFVTAERLDHLSRVFADMSAHVGGKPPPGLLDVPGVRPE